MKSHLTLWCKFLLLFLVNIFALDATAFHAILVGDTNDQILHHLIKADISHVKNQLNALIPYLEVDHANFFVITGNHVDSKLLVKLSELPISPNDIVFFYFSGHGFQKDKRPAGDWPYFKFANDNRAINQCQVAKLLKAYQPKLLICFSDCCNNVREFNEISNLSLSAQNLRLKIAGQPDYNIENIRKLFLEEEGVIMICSSSEGQMSQGSSRSGSYFTNYFLEVLHQVLVSKISTSWEEILLMTQNQFWKTQKPKFAIEKPY